MKFKKLNNWRCTAQHAGLPKLKQHENLKISGNTVLQSNSRLKGYYTVIYFSKPDYYYNKIHVATFCVIFTTIIIATYSAVQSGFLSSSLPQRTDNFLDKFNLSLDPCRTDC